MDTYPALLLPSWASAIEAVGHATSGHVDGLVDSILVAPQQIPQPRSSDLSRFVADRASFREFVEARGAWARQAFTCLLHGTRPRRAQETFKAECDWAVADTHLVGDSREHEANQLIELVQGLDAILVMQAGPDVEAAILVHRNRPSLGIRERFEAELLSQYRWRHLGCGFHRRGFALMLRGLLAPATRARVEAELLPIVGPIRREP
jgi:hypothetical protein